MDQDYQLPPNSKASDSCVGGHIEEAAFLSLLLEHITNTTLLTIT